MLETSLGYDGNGNYNVGDPHVNLLILSTPIISSGNGGASSCLIQMLWIYSCGRKWLVCFTHEETFVLLVVSYNWGNCCSVPGVTVMGCCCQRVLMGGSNGPCLVSLHHWFSALWYSLKTLSTCKQHHPPLSLSYLPIFLPGWSESQSLCLSLLLIGDLIVF